MSKKINGTASLIFITMAQKYIALPWPDYQEYMEEKWFRKETYYDSN